MFCLFAHERFLPWSQNSVLNSTIQYRISDLFWHIKLILIPVLACQSARGYSLQMNSIKNKLRCMRYTEKSVTNGYFISFFFPMIQRETNNQRPAPAYLYRVLPICTTVLCIVQSFAYLYTTVLFIVRSFAYLYTVLTICSIQYCIEFCLFVEFNSVQKKIRTQSTILTPEIHV